MKILILIILALHSIMYMAIAGNPKVRHLKNFAYILAAIVLLATAYQGKEVYNDYKAQLENSQNQYAP